VKSSVEAVLIRGTRTQDGNWLAVCTVGGKQHAISLPSTFAFREGRRIRVIVEREGRAVLA